MRVNAIEARVTKRGRTTSAILFSVARQSFAIAAETVQEVRSTDGLTSAASEFRPSGFPSIRHTLDHGGRIYYVVNACIHFTLPVTRPSLVLILRPIRVAILVDLIERMAEILAPSPLPNVFQGKERTWYSGLTQAGEQVIPVLNPYGLVPPEEVERLDALVESQAQSAVLR